MGSERYRRFAVSGRARRPNLGGLSPGNSVRHATVLEDGDVPALLSEGEKGFKAGAFMWFTYRCGFHT